MGFADTEQPDTFYSEELDETFTFEYFLFGGDIPVRIHVDNNGGWRGAKALKYQSGEFEYSNNYLTSIPYDSTGDADKVTKEEFYKACDKYLAGPEPYYMDEEKLKKDIEELKKRGYQ